MRRRIRRRKNKQKQIIIIATVCLLILMTVGYAAFQTNITIIATGNILCSGEDAKDKIIADSFVESGSGLSGIYKDSYENDRYVYRGAEVDNYITFDGEPWRIIAIESNGTLKIVKNDSLGAMIYDNQGDRDSASSGKGGTYCAYSSWGCNVWAATENMVNTPTEFISANGSYKGTVLLDSSLNEYLNGEWYYDLSIEDQERIVSYTYNIGGVSESESQSTSYTMEEQLEDESAYKWTGKVALINLSDYIRSNSSNDNYCNINAGSSINNSYYTTCRSTTWMYDSSNYYGWTITPYGDYTYGVWHVDNAGRACSRDDHSVHTTTNVRPVVHLNSDLKLSGSGTEEDPYVIEDC